MDQVIRIKIHLLANLDSAVRVFQFFSSYAGVMTGPTDVSEAGWSLQDGMACRRSLLALCNIEH